MAAFPRGGKGSQWKYETCTVVTFVMLDALQLCIIPEMQLRHYDALGVISSMGQYLWAREILNGDRSVRDSGAGDVG